MPLFMIHIKQLDAGEDKHLSASWYCNFVVEAESADEVDKWLKSLKESFPPTTTPWGGCSLTATHVTIDEIIPLRLSKKA